MTEIDHTTATFTLLDNETVATDESIKYLFVSPDGGQIAFIDNEGNGTVWDRTEESVHKTSIPMPFSIACDPTGHAGVGLVMFATESGGVKTFSLASGQQIAEGTFPYPMFGLAFSPDGKLAAGTGMDGRVWVWKVNSSGFVLQDRLPAMGCCVAFTRDGRQLVAVSDNCAIMTWDIDNGALSSAWYGVAGGGSPRRPKLSPDGRWVLIRDEDVFERYDVVDTTTGEPIASWKGYITALYSSPSGSLVIWDKVRTSEEDTVEMLRAYHVQGARHVCTLEEPGYRVAISLDGSCLVAGRENGLVIWEAA